MHRATLKDIAKKARVSVMTVSRALNEKPDVRSETRLEIMRIARDMGYVPNASARILKGAETKRIGVVVSDIRNPFYSQMVGELEDISDTHGYTVVVADTNRRLSGEVSAIESLMATTVDCLIVAPEGYKTSHLDDWIVKGMNFLSFGVHFPNKRYTEVWIDEIEGGAQVGSLFVRLGVSKPLLIMGNPLKYTTKGRIQGFIEGYGKEQIEKIHTEFLEVDWSVSQQFIRDHFSQNQWDGIFCYNDLMAMGAIQGLWSLGIHPGKDIPVVGYDDVPFAEMMGITTMQIPIREMVKKALEMIEQKERKQVKYIPKLILREST